MKVNPITTLLSALMLFLIAYQAHAQTTAFTYQGKLADNGNLANDKYDFQFRLFDTPTVGTGTQQGTTLTVTNVQVTNGLFSAQLDFGACPTCFNGANRYLEISVKQISNSTYTTLSPRQQMTSTPYALQSANATSADGLSVSCANCVTSSQIQSLNGSQITGTIPVGSVPSGSGNYIQNTVIQQTGANFNVSGNGTAGGTLSATIVNAVAQFNLGGLRVFSANGPFFNGDQNFNASNTFVGDSAGLNTTPDPSPTGFSGKFNAFFGAGAGKANTTGVFNAFFGYLSGNANTIGEQNTFFGSGTGRANTTGSNNAFFGFFAGANNTIGAANAFFGDRAGSNNTIGVNNSFFGETAGGLNTTGSNNAFFGFEAGVSNTSGSDNAFFGRDAGQNNTMGNGNAFFGPQSGFNNTIGIANSFFGLGAGYSNTTGDTNSFFGQVAGRFTSTGISNAFFGSESGENNTTGNYNSGFGVTAGNHSATGDGNSFFGSFAGYNMVTGSANTYIGESTDSTDGLTNATAIGSKAFVSASNSMVLGSINGINGATSYTNVGIGTTAPQARLHVNGIARIETFGSGGIAQICRNNLNELSTCSSSLRYKENLAPFSPGLDLINRLKPITFTWKSNHLPDLGLAAEEVAAIEPLLVTQNDKGEVEGVKYDRINVVLINAVKEQQAQIKQQQAEIEALKKLVCLDHPNADMCKAK